MAKKIETKYVLSGEDRTKGALNSMQNNFKKTNKSVVSLQSGVGSLLKLAGPLAAMASVAGIVALGNKSLKAADHVNKMSEALNMSTEAFSEYQHAAELSGVELPKLEAALRTMNQRIAESATGTGSATKYLDRLSLSSKKLSALKADKKFELIADALMGVANESDRAMIAGKLFGEMVGAKLIPMMSKGSVGIREMRQEFETMGGSISKESAQAASDAIDAATRIDARWTAMTNSMTLGFAPQIVKALNWVNKTVSQLFPTKQAKRNADELSKKMQELRDNGTAANFRHFWGTDEDKVALAQYAQGLLDAAHAMESWGSALNAIPDVAKVFQFGSTTAPETKKELEDMLSYDEVLTAVAMANIGLTNAKKPVIEINKALMKTVQDGTQTDIRWIKVAKTKLELLKELKNVDPAGRDFGPPGPPGMPKRVEPIDKGIDVDAVLFEGMKNYLNFVIENMPILLDLQKQYKDLLNETAIKASVLIASNNALAKSFSGVVGGSIDLVSDSLGMLINNMFTAKDEFIMFGRAFRRMISGIISDLIRLIVKAVIANALLSALGLTGANLTGIKKIFQGSIMAMGGLQGKAMGGPVIGNKPYLIGERGPELFTPNTSGNITPNHQMGGSNGIENVNITINAEGNLLNDPLSLRRVTEAINDELTKVQGTYFEPSTA